MARQLFNVAKIKYHCLNNGGHSVRFLNRFGKFIQSSNKISDVSSRSIQPSHFCLSFRPLLVHGKQKFSERCQIGSWIFGVISKGLYENDTFLKTSYNGEFNFIKRPRKT